MTGGSLHLERSPHSDFDMAIWGGGVRLSFRCIRIYHNIILDVAECKAGQVTELFIRLDHYIPVYVHVYYIRVLIFKIHCIQRVVLLSINVFNLLTNTSLNQFIIL